MSPSFSNYLPLLLAQFYHHVNKVGIVFYEMIHCIFQDQFQDLGRKKDGSPVERGKIKFMLTPRGAGTNF
jgi:hypothetical protein